MEQSVSVHSFLSSFLTLAVILAGQLLVGTAAAERRVLGRSVKMGRVLGHVWAVHFVLLSLPFLWKGGVSGKLDGYTWASDLGTALVAFVVVFGFGRMCWRRYTAAVEFDASREQARQNARILSSRI